VTGGFVTDPDHLSETNRFLAPMDQTHTFTGGLTWRHAASGLWLGTAVEYGSGTPMGHGDEHDHAADGAADDGMVMDMAADTPRVPGHLTATLSAGIDLLKQAGRTLSLRLDVENLTDNLYLVAQDSEFSPGQYSIPRLVSVTARLRF
jgi:outer membrane receptor protein involved in Fe transport